MSGIHIAGSANRRPRFGRKRLVHAARPVALEIERDVVEAKSPEMGDDRPARLVGRRRATEAFSLLLSRGPLTGLP